jgi:hypothetical protein
MRRLAGIFALKCALGVGVLVVAPGCRTLSTKGLPCTEDGHCDPGQSCSTGSVCVEGTGATDTGTATDPCTAHCEKVDFLFVVDNSASVDKFVDGLIWAVGTVQVQLEEFFRNSCDYHVGLVTTTPQTRNPAGCRSLGDLSVVDGNQEGDSAPSCELENGRYITKADEEHFRQRYQCLLRAGTEAPDTDESPIGAMFSALHPARNAPGACNDGFIRDDAALIVVIISDIDELVYDGGPGDWFTELQNRKGGHAENVSVLAIVPTAYTAECDRDEAVRLEQFVDDAYPDHGLVADLCDQGDTEAVLADALSKAPGNCRDFIPPA